MRCLVGVAGLVLLLELDLQLLLELQKRRWCRVQAGHREDRRLV